MKKKKTTRKKAAAKRTAARKPGAARVAQAREISLQEWFDLVRGPVESAEVPVASGACLVKDPRTGQSYCIRTTPDTCKALKGVFVGGPCGG
jgi:hypothetical protein